MLLSMLGHGSSLQSSACSQSHPTGDHVAEREREQSSGGIIKVSVRFKNIAAANFYIFKCSRGRYAGIFICVVRMNR